MTAAANDGPTPTVSVVIPTYNGERYLAEALDSVAAQHGHSGVEVLAVDDGSVDGTVEMLRVAAARLPIRILDGPRRRNWVASTNAALREARGSYVCILHQDDRWHPDRLARLSALAAIHPDVDVWLHPSRFIGPEGQVLGRWDCPWPKNRRLAPCDWLPRLLVQNVVAVPAVLFRRTLLDDVGFMDEARPYTADWEFWLRMARAHSAWVLSEPLSDFRVHPESQTFALAHRPAEFAAQLRDVVEQYRSDARRLGASGRVEAMALLGVEVNAWLAARVAGARSTARPMVRAAWRCGMAGTAAYVRASQLVPRVLARLRIRRAPRRSAVQRPDTGA